jgi:hypothetical protein
MGSESRSSSEVFKEANQHLHGLTHKAGRVYWEHVVDPDDDDEDTRSAITQLRKDVSDVLFGAGLRLVRVRVQDNVITAEIDWLSPAAWRASRKESAAPPKESSDGRNDVRIAEEIKSARRWLDSIEKDLQSKTVISGGLVLYLSESVTKIAYVAGQYNQSLLDAQESTNGK